MHFGFTLDSSDIDLWNTDLSDAHLDLLDTDNKSNSNLLMADVFWVLKIIMGQKAETYTFNQVKELLQMHENTLLNVFNSTIDRLDKKIDILKEENSKIKKELTDLRESV